MSISMRPGLSWDMADIGRNLGQWGEMPLGEFSGWRLLEALSHEVAHVVGATGAAELGPGDCVADIVLAITTTRARDFNEVRASSVTHLVMLAADCYTEQVGSHITESMLGNMSAMHGDEAKAWFVMMRESRRSKQMALKVIDYLMANGAIVMDDES